MSAAQAASAEETVNKMEIETHPLVEQPQRDVVAENMNRLREELAPQTQ